MRSRGVPGGFTLVEALLCVALLAFVSLAFSGLFGSGLHALASREVRGRLDSEMRSCMEALLSQPYDRLADGATVVIVNGVSYTISWTVTAADLDGDAQPEPSVRRLTVTDGERVLTTLVADHAGLSGTI